jgi:glyoxylase-like metal-dependent hydrolase (beta-lactamase superfamily II)
MNGSFTTLDLGGPRLYWLDGGGFRSDGGVQFGPVPRRRWAALYPPAEDNTIPLTAHVVLVEDPGTLSLSPRGERAGEWGSYPQNRETLVEAGPTWGLIESGLGHHLSAKQRRFYMVERESELEQGLAEVGITPGQIDWVVLTHLHLDHAGGVLRRDEQGRIAPEFPRAHIFVQALEAREARDPTNRAHAVYTGDSFDRLEEAGLVREVDGDAQVTPNVGVFLTGGHTRGHQGALVRGADGAALLHLGELVVTHAHLSPGWVSANDDFPLDSIRAKRDWLGRAAKENWWVAYGHDARYTAGRVDATPSPLAGRGLGEGYRPGS